MNIADEASGAHLKAEVHSCARVASMEPQTATATVNKCFEKWGLPVNIKIDNGAPFVHPGHLDIPTKTKMWWIGLGINVIQNTPRCPQQNGIVECLQGTLCRWTNPKEQPNITALQQRLDEESDFQRNHYQIPARKYRTRAQIYPAIYTNNRTYDPQNFDMQKVYQFLSEQVWLRTITSSGEFKMFGTRIYIGRKYDKEDLTVTFDPIHKQWIIRTINGVFMKSSPRGVPTEKEIKDFSLMSKN